MIRDLNSIEVEVVNKITGTVGQKTSSKEMEELWVKLNQMMKQSEKE
tara:strand:+ start:530 stop:670 length:141 start_codon:yes stop_codon:yes gene_type:complete